MAPATPAILTVATDDIVNAAEQAAAITGTAEMGASVALTIGGATRTVTAHAQGQWSYTLTGADIAGMGEGGETLSVKATDASGNTSGAATCDITVDTKAPGLPTISIVAVDDTVNAAEQAVAITGTAESKASVALTLGGNIRTVQANDLGAWSYTLTPADIAAMGQGAEVLSVRATDKAGNTSDAATRDIKVDTVAPNAPTLSIVAGDDFVNASEQTAAITGTAEADARVLLTIGANTRTVTANNMGVWSYTLTPADITSLGQGTSTLSATAADAAGNISGAATRNITVDTVAPSLPVISKVAGDDIVNASEQTVAVTGTAEVNASVRLTLGGNTRTVTANAQGDWTYTLTAADITAMDQGSETLSVTARDAAGNTSTAATRAITVDTLAPVAPTISVVATDDVVNAGEQAASISGTAEANASVALSIGGNTRTVTASSGGAWAYTLTPADISAMGQGSETLSVLVTDAAGNTSVSVERPITVDTVAPNAPTISKVAGDDIVNAGEQTAAISGTAEANASVALTIGGNIRTLTASTGGAWTYTLTAADLSAMGQGAQTLSVTATDAAGNTSAASTRGITVDTLAPSVPLISKVAGDDIVNASEQSAAITGTAEAGATVALTIGSNTRAVTANAQGDWTYTLTASDITAMGQGDVTLSVKATYAAGNVSQSGTRAIKVDTCIPDAPTIAIVATDDTVNASEQAVAITGTAEALSSVRLSIGGNTRTVTAGAGGAWTYTLTPADITAMGQGAEPLSATATDAAGNVSAATARNITVDTIAPSAPMIAAVASDDRINAAEQTATISGTAEANAALALSIGTLTRAVTANAQGAWTYTLTAADITAMGEGAETLSVTATDAAGNTSAAGTRDITVDTLAPAAPVISDVAGDNVINGSEQSAAIAGTAEPNAAVALTIGANVRTVMANAQGAWTYTLTSDDITAMGQGPETLSAKATDAAGNTSDAGTRSLTVDTVAPNAPSISSVAGDDVINAGEQTASISGTTEANASVALTFGGTVRTVTANGSGAWTYTLTSTDVAAMGQGSETLSVKATDAAGNISAAGTRGITVDTVAPGAPTISTVAADDTVNASEQTSAITGTAEAGASVVLTIGTLTHTVTANDQGNWTYTLATADIAAMGQGDETLSAAATDAAGNVSSAGTRSIKVDTLVPNAPTMLVVAGDDVVNATEQTAAVAGTAEANATVTLTLGGNTRTVTANAQGDWTYTLTAADIAAMGQGEETLSATARDAAGNVSAAGTRSITVDTEAMDPPTISKVAGDDIVNASEQAAAITGTAEANASVALTIGTQIRSATANSSGDWTYTLTAADIAAMGQGEEILSAQATDK